MSIYLFWECCVLSLSLSPPFLSAIVSSFYCCYFLFLDLLTWWLIIWVRVSLFARVFIVFNEAAWSKPMKVFFWMNRTEMKWVSILKGFHIIPRNKSITSNANYFHTIIRLNDNLGAHNYVYVCLLVHQMIVWVAQQFSKLEWYGIDGTRAIKISFPYCLLSSMNLIDSIQFTQISFRSRISEKKVAKVQIWKIISLKISILCEL